MSTDQTIGTDLTSEQAAAPLPPNQQPEAPPAQAPDNAFVKQASAALSEPSIVDTILDLDELLSADVRRAERTARFSVRADLEAQLDDLEAELFNLTDGNGTPLPVLDQAVGAAPETGGRTATVVALEIAALRREMAASFRSVRMRQVSDEDWAAFHTTWRKVLDGDPPYSNDFWNALIVLSASAPKISDEQVKQMRTKLGRPAMELLGNVAWHVNTKSGLDIPKSQLSSAVLRRAVHARN